jgi:hypothetical protein
VISPNGGTFTNSVQVTLACTTSGAQIHYTTEGSAPTSNSTLYVAALTLTSNTTVRAIAVAAGMTNSQEADAAFTVNQPPANLPAPDISALDGKTFTMQDTISLNYSGNAGGFNWEFVRSGGTSASAGGLWGSASLNGSTIDVPTAAPRMSVANSSLSPGQYQLRVQVQIGGQTSPWSAPATISLVETDFVAARVYPNPWRAARGDGDIIFDQLPANSTVKIFTVSGRWVKTLSAPGGSVPWNLTNESGEKAASGLYLYLITDSQGDKAHGKFGVIR